MSCKADHMNRKPDQASDNCPVDADELKVLADMKLDSFRRLLRIPTIDRLADHYALSSAALDKARTVNADHIQTALDELRP